MNFPTYPVGTLVQIISAAEFDALPKNDAGCALFLDPLPNGNADYIPPKRRSLCGSIMQIDRKLDASGFYFLKPYDLSTADPPLKTVSHQLVPCFILNLFFTIRKD